MVKLVLRCLQGLAVPAAYTVYGDCFSLSQFLPQIQGVDPAPRPPTSQALEFYGFILKSQFPEVGKDRY